MPKDVNKDAVKTKTVDVVCPTCKAPHSTVTLARPVRLKSRCSSLACNRAFTILGAREPTTGDIRITVGYTPADHATNKSRDPDKPWAVTEGMTDARFEGYVNHQFDVYDTLIEALRWERKELEDIASERANAKLSRLAAAREVQRASKVAKPAYVPPNYLEGKPSKKVPEINLDAYAQSLIHLLNMKVAAGQVLPGEAKRLAEGATCKAGLFALADYVGMPRLS